LDPVRARGHHYLEIVLHSCSLLHHFFTTVGRGFPGRSRAGDGGGGLRGEQREARPHLGAARRLRSAPGRHIRGLHQRRQAQKGCTGNGKFYFHVHTFFSFLKVLVARCLSFYLFLH
jgi:hypothetical protein